MAGLNMHYPEPIASIGWILYGAAGIGAKTAARRFAFFCMDSVKKTS